MIAFTLLTRDVFLEILSWLTLEDIYCLEITSSGMRNMFTEKVWQIIFERHFWISEKNFAAITNYKHFSYRTLVKCTHLLNLLLILQQRPNGVQKMYTLILNSNI